MDCGIHNFFFGGVTRTERFNSNNARTANREVLNDIINDSFTRFNREELRIRLADTGIAYGAVNSVDEMSRHPVLRRREVFASNGDSLSIPSSPVVSADRERDQVERPPTIGEQDASIREEFSR
jgi:crotonobetainyl-CoA:carnitine CoA-transferase CaiB-like acyl-CoA transferase